MIDDVYVTDRAPVSLWKKINPLWWLVGPDGWTVPDINNGEPYLPEVKNIWLRRFYWFFCRNPGMNFAGFVLGVEDRNYVAIGTYPVMLTTWRDATPPRTGWKWSVIEPSSLSIPALIFAIMFSALTGLHWAFVIPAVFASLKVGGPLPFVSWFNGSIEFYLGWRPSSGGFGIKIVRRAS